MSDVLEELVTAGLRTKLADAHFVLAHYIRHPHRLHCFLAQAGDGAVLGFQSLKVADEQNPYGTPWGIIGTHVRPSAARKGVGSRLSATLEAVRQARLPAIEAFIGEQNTTALAYYEAIGFRTYRRADGVICKAFHLTD
jgi:ribosomal protein S18 acetylase RimI-like enzyme